MAISQMRKLALVFPKDASDDVLLSLQKTHGVEIRHLTEMPDWQTALASDAVQSVGLSTEDLSDMQAYQKELETVIKQLQRHLPTQSMFKRLKTPKQSLSFEELEFFGEYGQGNVTLTNVRERLQTLERLEEQIADINDKIDSLLPWQTLELIPNQLKAFSHIKALVGTIPSSNEDRFFKAMQSNPDLAFEKIYNTESEYGLVVFASSEIADLEGYLSETYEFKRLTYTQSVMPATYLKDLLAQQETADVNRRALLKDLSQSFEGLEALQLQLDYHLNHQARQMTKEQLLSTANLTALEGWVQSDDVSHLEQQLQKDLGNQVFIRLMDIEEEDWDDVPIQLKNNAFVAPFELVTEMYALPKYYEKDPTPFLAPFYFTFFGMMVADLGYGLVLFLATLVALKAFHLDKASERFIKFFNLLGISVSLWGLIYGSFFGYNLPFHLLSTTDDVLVILGLSVVFGFITLIFGLIMGGLQHIRMKAYAQAYHSGFAWVMILSGIALLAVGKILPDMAILATIGSGLAIINALGILIVSVIESKGLGGLGSGLFNLYNISSYAGDLVSFTRLMALGLSGASIGSAFNLIVDIFPIWAKFSIGILVFIILHSVNLFLSLLSGYVHGARLMFVEFFGKFYEGGGRAFKPLKPAEKYVTIKKEVHLEDK